MFKTVIAGGRATTWARRTSGGWPGGEPWVPRASSGRGVSDRRAESTQPQADSGGALRCETVEVALPLAGQDVAQPMVVDDDGRHYVVAR
jgi:hypothetical protein